MEHTLRTLQGQKVKPPWDLALILNPASDSVLVRQLVRDLESLYRYDPRPVPDSPLKWAGRYEPRSGGNPISENQPTIVELQSENDSATGLTFPIGSSLGVLVGGHWTWNRVAVPGESNDPKPRAIVSEREFYLRTPGNSRYLINYVVVPWKVPEFPQRVRRFRLQSSEQFRRRRILHERSKEFAGRSGRWKAVEIGTSCSYHQLARMEDTICRRKGLSGVWAQRARSVLDRPCPFANHR